MGEEIPGLPTVRSASGYHTALTAIRLGNSDQNRTNVPTIDQVISSSGSPGGPEIGEPERALPGSTPVIGIVETRLTCVHTRHAEGQSEVRVRELDSSGAILDPGLDQFGWCNAMQGFPKGDQEPPSIGVFDRPGLAAIQASRQQVKFGFLGIKMMLQPSFFVVSLAEPDQDLIAPGPDSVVGGPSPETARLPVNVHVTENAGSAG